RGVERQVVRERIRDAADVLAPRDERTPGVGSIRAAAVPEHEVWRVEVADRGGNVGLQVRELALHAPAALLPALRVGLPMQGVVDGRLVEGLPPLPLAADA